MRFADFLCSLGFFATRYDRDVWMRKGEAKNGYNYICTYVENIKIVTTYVELLKSLISTAFLLRSIGPPSYNLGNDLSFLTEDDAWTEVDSNWIFRLFLIVNIRVHSDYACFGIMHILRLLDYAYSRMA